MPEWRSAVARGEAAAGAEHTSIVPGLRRRRSDEDDAAVPERRSAAVRRTEGRRRRQGRSTPPSCLCSRDGDGDGGSESKDMATGGDLMRMQLFLAEVVHLVLLLVWGRRSELRVVASWS
ncbi:hypothetical protein OsI_26196 [Oryza sativa Indica Group]|uniref:Uncharacterized protein n=1 Tax=Oryza sativa subsp. indica TaxID=39946 RepID=A2YLU8_ORYSI|nr:hypothetical protein OsI_26196 [Oryza sativa Indica Group]